MRRTLNIYDIVSPAGIPPALLNNNCIGGPMAYDQFTFMRLVREANPGFNQQKSSLAPLIAAVNNIRGDKAALMKAEIAKMPLNKKMKYQKALAYLELELAKKPLGVPQPPKPPGIERLEKKIGWKEGKLLTNKYMVHCTGAPPDIVMTRGIDPQKSREWCIADDLTDAPIFRWNRFIFMFEFDEKKFPPKGADIFGFNENGHIYVVNVPAQTEFMNQTGTILPGRETGFPFLIASSSVMGIFQYNEIKSDYTLKQIQTSAPFNVIHTATGKISKTDEEKTQPGTYVKRWLQIP